MNPYYYNKPIWKLEPDGNKGTWASATEKFLSFTVKLSQRHKLWYIQMFAALHYFMKSAFQLKLNTG